MFRARSRWSVGQALDEDRDEDDVVDAEHDLEDRQRQQGDPRLGVVIRRDVHAYRGYRRRRRGGLTGATGVPWRGRDQTRAADPRACPSSTSRRRRASRLGRAARRRQPADARLGEYRPGPRALPRFHVWTLGCQMNRSDSEEMAGRLLAAGCEEAPSMEAADLVVINTCAIREAAEQKVIGRQGHLARLKAANPAMRVVLTGCSVREPDRGGLRRRYPAVDLFLRPDEEPELVDRLGLASAQGADRAASATDRRSGDRRDDDRRAGRRRRRRRACRRPAPGAVGEGTVARGSAISAWLPIIYGCDKTCTYCIVPFSRGPERSRPFDDIVDEARALAAAGYREVTLLGQNVNSYGHDLRAGGRASRTSTRSAGPGRRLDLDGRPDLAELIRAIDGLRTADGAPAIPRLRFVTSHPWDLSDRLIAAHGRLPVGLRAPPPAGPVGRRRGAPPDGPPVHDRALPRAARPDPRGRARASRSRPT